MHLEHYPRAAHPIEQDTPPWPTAAVLPTQEAPGADADSLDHGQAEVQAGYQAIVELAPDALVTTDRDGCIRLVNRQTEVLFGYARDDLLGHPIERLIPERFHAAHQQYRATYTATPRTCAIGGTAAALQIFGQRRDGSEFPVEMRLSPLVDATGALSVISVMRDVSERQQAEAAHREHARERDLEVARARAAHQSHELGKVLAREHAALEGMTQARHQLEALQALTDTTLEHLALDDLLPAVLERMQQVLYVDNVAILLLDADGQTLRVRAARGLEEVVAAQVRVPVGEGFAGCIAARRAPLIVDDLASFPVANPFLRERLRAVAGVPLLLHDQLLGVLHVGSATMRQFTEQEVGLLQRAADRVALAIERARLFEAEQVARREAEREQVRWQAAMDNAPEFVITCDADLRRTYVNPAYARLRGGPADLSVPVEEVPARHGLFLPNGTDLFSVEQMPLTRAVREGRPVHGVEMVLYDPDNEQHLVVWEAAPMRSAGGELLGAVAIGRDVTERKRAEEALCESEERYRAVVETQTEMISHYLPDTTLTFVNEVECRMTGLSREELLGTRFIELLPDAAREPVQATIQSLLAQPGVRTVEHEIRLPDGSLRWQQWVNRTILDQDGHVVELQGIGRDITERKQAEEALRESEARFRAAFESPATGMLLTDPTGHPLQVNRPFAEMLGYTEAELRTMTFAEFTHPDDLEPNLTLFHQALAGEIDRYHVEKRYVHKQGHLVWVFLSAGVVRDTAGQPLYLVVQVQDITERKRLEREREEARAEAERQAAQLDRVFEQMADGVTLYDAQGRIARENAAQRRILGLDAAPPGYYDLSLNEQTALYHVRDEQGHPLAPEDAPIARVLRGEVLSGPNAMDLHVRTLDGRDVELNVSVAPLQDRHGRLVGAVRVMRDQTERKRLQREREAARAGELALREVNRHMEQFLATASHDLRTPVTGVVMGIALAQRRLQQLAALSPPSPPLLVRDRPADQPDAFHATLNALERASGAAQRLSQLILRLFDVAQARTGTLELKLATCDLAALVHAEVAAQRALASERIIRLDLDANISVPVVADSDRLGQVVANYLANALKYSPVDQPVDVALKVEAGQGRVVVRDAGPGLPPEEQTRVWGLFHRAPGVSPQGSCGGSMGLGLYISKQIVERHGGQVGVESAPGCGSTFWFTLPLETPRTGENASDAPTS